MRNLQFIRVRRCSLFLLLVTEVPILWCQIDYFSCFIFLNLFHLIVLFLLMRNLFEVRRCFLFLVTEVLIWCQIDYFSCLIFLSLVFCKMCFLSIFLYQLKVLQSVVFYVIIENFSIIFLHNLFRFLAESSIIFMV